MDEILKSQQKLQNMVYEQLQKRMSKIQGKMAYQNYKISKIIGIEEFRVSPMKGKYLSTNPIWSEQISLETLKDEFDEFDSIMQKSVLVDEGIRNSDILTSIGS